MKTNSFISAVVFTAISLTFFACSSGGGSSISYTCQLATSCIQVESVSDCSAAGGTVADACPFNSGGSSSPSGNGGRYSGSYGSISHGGQSYKTVVIGTQTWMAENLNYNASGSKCYGEGGSVDSKKYVTLTEDEIQANCTKYGRLYDWATAMTACPNGWHIPTNEEWEILENYVGGSSTAGRYLKATNGWSNNGNGTDSYGFAALPGGNGAGYAFLNVGSRGFWWNASYYNDSYTYYRIMYYEYEGVYAGSDSDSDISIFLSVRCIKE